MRSTYFLLSIILILVILSGCETVAAMVNGDKVCSDDVIEEATKELKSTPVDQRHTILGGDLLAQCRGVSSDGQMLGDAIAGSTPTRRMEIVHRWLLEYEPEAWSNVCSGGIGVYDDLAMAEVEERPTVLWEGCELDGRLPISKEESQLDDDVSSHVNATLLLLLIGYGDGEVGEDDPLAPLVRLVFMSE